MSQSRPWRSESRLRELYVERRLSTREVGEELGCSRRTVENWIDEYGLMSEAKPWRDEERLRELRDQGLSEAEIARRLECSQATVHNWLVRFDLDTSRVSPDHPWHDEEVLRRLYCDQELTMGEVADVLQCSRKAVEDWIHRHEIDTRSRTPETPERLRDRETLEQLYLDQKMSTYDIAAEVGCVPSAVHNWLQQHDIETRQVGSQPGQLHHRWKGGKEPYYGSNWMEQRRKALKRDDRRCVECGLTEDEHRQQYEIGLDVHHRTPIRTFDDPANANTLDNLVTLCRACHNRIEPPNSQND